MRIADVNIDNVFLETERLIIRPWKQSDLKDFFEYASVDGAGEMAGWNHHRNIEESQNILDMFINEHKTFALEAKDSKKAIGSIGIETITPDIRLDAPYKDMAGREIGYVLSKEYWGKGLMTEAVKKIIDFCFNDLLLDYLFISHWVENDRSRRVIEKCGFEFVKEFNYNCKTGEKRESRGYIKMCNRVRK